MTNAGAPRGFEQADQSVQSSPNRARPRDNGNLNSGDDDSRRPYTPPPASEFQKFVEGATGRLLPVFGSSFFADATGTFAPVDNVPVSADYVVGPGDEVLIRAWGSIDVDYRATVDRNGFVNLPKVGSFSVAGIKAADLDSQLRAQIGRLFTNFNLSVTLGQLRAVKVFVVGPAQRPGVYTVSSQSTFLSAVVAAGGPGTNGSMRRINLRRNGSVISELDLYEFLVRGDKSKDMQLAPGDVVVFQPVGPRVALTGAIDTPGIYELKSPQEPVAELLRYAGGAPILANPNQAQLERIDSMQPGSARFVEGFKLDSTGLQKPVRDGDVLTLLTISPQIGNAVTLKGPVAQPLRYAWTPGMRVRDLIPNKEALIDPDFYRRKNVLVQIDSSGARQSGQLGSQAPQQQQYGQPSQQQGQQAFDPRYSQNASGSQPLAAALQQQRGQQGQASQNPLIGDPVSGQRAANPSVSNDRPRARTDTLFTALNWDYAVIERLNPIDLTTQILPFNLGRAVLQGDETQNLELRPGDVVTIYSQRDIRVPVGKQTRLALVEGEVSAPGVYPLEPGETLRQLIARAGGFTPQAYAYGIEFSREETRKQQGENLQAAVQRLETLAATQAAREAANQREEIRINNAGSQATTIQAQRLRNLQPNGRIALELSPRLVTVDELPDVPLENADRVLVPARPGFVTVVGAVANNNALLWKAGRTVGDYLRLAGLDEAAEPDNAFILRADGTVVSATDRRGFFGGSKLESEVLFAGDSLVVPNQLDFETWGRAFVRNLKDFTQIFSNFGIGVAAIHSLNN